jgi:quercetin dioxygenase-like cupin family protein
MSDYAHINLLELDDAGAAVDGLEVRLGRSQLGSRDLGVSHFRYAPGVRSISHRHEQQEEAYVVTAGSGHIRLDGELRELQPWDVVRVAPEVVRGFEAGPDGLDVVAVGGPRPEGGDGMGSDEPWPA